MSTVRGFAHHRPRTTITGLVLRTTASRGPRYYGRMMTVVTDTGLELTGTIPASIRMTATTLRGRRVQFDAIVDQRTGRFSYPDNGTILPPKHLDHTATSR